MRPTNFAECEALGVRLNLDAVRIAEAFGIPTPLDEQLKTTDDPEVLWLLFDDALDGSEAQRRILAKIFSKIDDIDKLWETHDRLVPESQAALQILEELGARCMRKLYEARSPETLREAYNLCPEGSKAQLQGIRAICELAE